MKTKILAFLMAVMLVAGIVAVPTPVSAATDVNLDVTFAFMGDTGEIRIGIDGSSLPAGIVSDNLDSSLTVAGKDWDQSNAGDPYYKTIKYDFSKDLTFEITFTPDDTSTHNIATKKITLYSDAKVSGVPTLNDGKISAKFLNSALNSEKLTVMEGSLGGFGDAEKFNLLAAFSTFLNKNPLNLGTLAVFVDVAPEATGLSVGDEEFRLFVAGMKAGTPVTVLHLTGDNLFESLKATTGDGYIDITTSGYGFSPFLVFVNGAPNADVPETGDNTNMMLYTVIGMIALGGIGYMALRKRTTN